MGVLDTGEKQQITLKWLINCAYGSALICIKCYLAEEDVLKMKTYHKRSSTHKKETGQSRVTFLKCVELSFFLSIYKKGTKFS